jgi:hypothetical protein
MRCAWGKYQFHATLPARQFLENATSPEHDFGPTVGCMSLVCYGNFEDPLGLYADLDFGHCQIIVNQYTGFHALPHDTVTRDLQCDYAGELVDDIVIDAGPSEYRFREVTLFERLSLGRIEALSANWHDRKDKPTDMRQLGVLSQKISSAQLEFLLATIAEVNEKFPDANWGAFGFNCVPASLSTWAMVTATCPAVCLSTFALLVPDPPYHLIQALNGP